MNPATKPQVDSSSGVPHAPASRDLEFVLRLIESLKQGEDRRDAAQRFVHLLAQILPDNQVILAMGSATKCNFLVDSTVGQLGLDTPMAQKIQSCWADFALRLKQSEESQGTAAVQSLYTTVQGTEPGPGTTGREYWRLPLSGQGDQIGWLFVLAEPRLPLRLRELMARCSDVLGHVLWSAPKRHSPLRDVWQHQDNRRKLIFATAALALLMLLPVRYRVACNAIVEPKSQRLVATPFDAQLKECFVRPGDRVSADQLLCQLDDSPLKIERDSLVADLEQAKKQQDVAMATGQVAEAQLAKLQRDSLRHQIQLIDKRLKSLAIRCPIDGVVVAGDLRKAKGMPFETGDTMFEVAPLDEMTFEIEIPEMEIGYVSAGSDVRVRLAALGASVSGTLERVYPQAEVRDEKNVFVAVWKIANASNDIRPGMEGSAVVYGPYRPLSWSWLRRGYEGLLRTLGW